MHSPRKLTVKTPVACFSQQKRSGYSIYVTHRSLLVKCIAPVTGFLSLTAANGVLQLITQRVQHGIHFDKPISNEVCQYVSLKSPNRVIVTPLKIQHTFFLIILNFYANKTYRMASKSQTNTREEEWIIDNDTDWWRLLFWKKLFK